MFSTLLNIAVSSLKYKFFGHRTPTVLSIGITSRCNLQCAYCYSAKDNLNARDVDLEHITKTIEKFYALGTRVVMLQGGEPMLHKDIAKIIDYVKSKNIYCSVTTNGVNFDKYIDSLKKVNQVQLSIDGNEELTDRNRGRGAYKMIINAANACRKNQIPFHFHTVIMNSTTVENCLDPLTALANEYKTYLNFCTPNPTGSAEGKKLADNKYIQNFYETILERKESNTISTNNSYHGIKGMIEWVKRPDPYYEYVAVRDPDAKKYSKCIMGDLVCWLDSDGMLHPCAVKYGQDEFSCSTKEHGVKEAWKSLKDLPCRFCGNSLEFNNLFNFKLESVVNSLKFIFRRN